MAGVKWTARVEWLQRQRPMWREHDAKLAAAWRRGETADLVIDSEIESGVDGELAKIIVLPDRSAADDAPEH